MTHSNANQPSLESLTLRFLATRSDATTAVERGESEVEPHEVAAGFRVDPRTAWIDANSHTTGSPGPLPTEWAALVSQPSAAFAIPMAAGHFPQRVKDLQPLLKQFRPADLRPTGEEAAIPAFTGLRAWVQKNAKSNALVAAGIARTLGDFETAEALLAGANETGNEKAALLWQSGKSEEALATWNATAATPAVLFNRGMAELFLGRFAQARASLQKAIDAIPEASGWNALARLYLAVAEIHG
ncbi:hypothetical protein GobsT_33200 [Gemmata obscuriglobus]|uniref:Tetratricopeptide repeat protein n=1 Tax=Gemmata obscuriglobus TaxID=114 RepID=A0A2Z3H0Y2_9BACT|nr:hypothetical protein [Gemmata obscuriglobus]AWM38511.1 tetratricopeptide repeat protein [Gemmata obscuriglobus]QEG28538.1 hypothetical protein GobsT_33200 [Gemmata obscuriglobus]VTS06622.1 hypothetical conserved protein : Hypothetical conserved protein OS=uncultured planctomycete GN=HGMM_F37F03C28 PE=4 SV=1: TPR_8 [Gemmata obscuriglobus UQM 2246]